MGDVKKQAIIAEIANLNQRYALAADSSDAVAFSGCFTEDGVFDRFGVEIRGRKALHRFMKPNAEIKRRHFISNAFVQFEADGSVKGHGYLMVVNFEVKTREQKLPVCVDFDDVYEETPAGWLIARRSVTLPF